jgi:lipopolysaccharide/colanic/teichoic acid biosynthesis glycosyltransferase
VDARDYCSQRPVRLAQTGADDELLDSPVVGPPLFATPSSEHRPAGVSPGHGWYLPLKRGCDLVLALVLVILSAPVVLLGAVLVKLTSRGPAVYRQVRVGLEGRTFTLLKLRTMKHNAEADTGPVWSTDNDGRVTAVGSLLRRTHIDEFPQLINVLRGEMSLIGPRPERPEFVAKLDWEVPFYRERLKVRPGITGLAQVRLGADTGLESVRRKIVNDVYYVRHVHPSLDAKLLVVTAWRLFKELVRFCWTAFALPSTEEVDRGFHRAVGIADDESGPAPVTLASISESDRQPERQTDVVEFATPTEPEFSRNARFRGDARGH